MWTVPLTEFQQEYLRNCSHRWNVKTGATRSGKTYLDCAVTIPKRICAARGEGLPRAIVVAVTLADGARLERFIVLR